MNRGTWENVRSDFGLNILSNIPIMTIKDYIVKILLAIIAVWVIGYAWRLLKEDATVVSEGMEQFNDIALYFVLAIWLFLLASVVKESLLPNNRWSVLLLWIAIIRASHVYLQDSPEAQVYLKDIMKLVWVFLCITWPMKLLTSEKYAEKKFEEEIEIVEV